MASYRPKSLNELNNLYDKSMAAQNAIKKGSSIVKPENDTSKQLLKAFEEELYAQKEKSPAITASEELSDVVGEFIKNFGETKKEKAASQPMPITRSVKSSVVKPSPKKEPAEKTEIKKVNLAQAQAQKQEPQEALAAKKADLVRNAERSDLFDDYMKIMNDEDEESHFSRKFSKKKKNKKDKHQGSPVFDSIPNAEELKEETASSEISETAHEEAPAEVTYFDEQANEVAQVFEDAAKSPLTEENAAEEEFASFYAEESTADEAPEEAEKAEFEKNIKEKNAKEEKPSKTKKQNKEKKPKKNVFLQVILMIVLVAVLISAASIGVLKVVVGVDSGKAFAEKYYMFTSSKDYSNSEIQKGDLIITEDKDLQENDAFAYLDMNKSKIAFALKGSDIGEDMLMAHTGSGTDFIYRSTLRGAVIKVIPAVGTVVSAVTQNFIIVITSLVAIALVLILILAFAFKGKSNYNIEDDEHLEQEPETEEEAESAAEEAEYEEEYDGEQQEASVESEEQQKEPEDIYSSIE